MNAVVTAHGLTKRYKNALALDDVSFRIDSGRFGITPIDRTSPCGSATATVMVSAWTSSPINRTFFMTGSFACGSAFESLQLAA